MLKKAGIVVATAAAGLLAMSPLAFAGGEVNDQEIEQESEQGNGILNGNNVVSGNGVNVCDVVDVNADVLLGLILAFAAQGDDSVNQSSSCGADGFAVGQETTQDASNKND